MRGLGVAKYFAMVVLFFTAFTLAAMAQGRATVYGTVTDPTGAVVPGAQVTLTNLGTQQTQHAVSASDGSYVIPSVLASRYSLKVEAQGFESFLAKDLVVQVDENRLIPVQLGVGAVGQEVVVTDTPVQVDTREGTLTQVIDAERVKDLPLNGRNPLDLQFLVAGAGNSTNLSGQQQNALVSFNGGRYNTNNYTLDGVDNEDPFFDSPSVVPNPDALDQFSIKTSNYGAQEGRSSGAQINAIIKSGTNKFHGSLFEYLRNEVLDAKPYLSDTVAPYRRNQFGGSIGGPILRDKLFFFFSYQGTRTVANPNAITLIVPSAAERAGNFAELCPAGFDASGTCKSTAKPNKQLTLPGTKTKAPFNNLATYVYPGSVNFMNALVPAANGAGNNYTYTPHTHAADDQYITRVDARLGERDTIFGHLIYVPTNNINDQTPALNLPGFLQDIKYTNWHVAINETHTFSPHLINVATFGYNNIVRHQSPIVPGDASWSGFGSGIVKADASGPKGFDTKVPTYFNAFAAWPLDQFRHEYQYSDMLSWTHGKHTITTGFDVRQNYTYQNQYFQGDGQVLFAASYTGDQLADFVTGRPNSITQGSSNAGRPRNVVPNVYLQDDWKATPRLTLNLGVRWEPFVAAHDDFGRVSTFRLGQQSTVLPNAPAGVLFPGDAGMPKDGIADKWNHFSPRVGFALDVFGNGKTSLRGGFGLYYSDINTQAYNSESLNQPYAYKLTINKPAGGLANPYGAGGSPYPYVAPDPSQYSSYQFTLPVTIQGFDPDFQVGRVEQWNINVQQQLPWKMISTIAYVGTNGEHLILTYDANPGVYSLGGKRQYAPTFDMIQQFNSEGHSNYHSLQMTLNKRLSHGITLMANYTWSKALDNITAQNTKMTNPFDFSDSRGLSDVDLRHVFVMSGIWRMPSLRNHFVNAVLGGWELNGIWSIQSGSPFTVMSGADNSKSLQNQDRADQIGIARTYPNRPRAQQMDEYFDTSAFTANAPGTFGTARRNSLIGPGQDRVTLGLVKRLVTVEQARLLFRAEFFNAFNHPTLNNPTANVSSAQFGKINGAGDPRVGQVALRVEF
ncbi:MAG: TonB-dependent receptor [Acidobacteria bacterium]|nr:TonB-dependent receptor [Acidobacteriota bacterium]